MNIRNRLTLTQAITTFAVLTAIGAMVYFVTAQFHEQEFAQRLKERVSLTEQIWLEKNEAVSQVVRDKFLQRLDYEEEYVITLQQTGLDSLDQLFYQGFSSDISSNKSVHFKVGDKQGVGKIYELSNGRYAVVVTAVDVFGHTKLVFLKRMLILGMLTGLAILIGVFFVSVRRALRPLENKIQKAKEISASNLDVRLEVTNPDDEIGQLTLAFNRMLDRIQSGFEAQRGFVSNASHEMRNPLAAIIGEADLLLEKERPVAEYQDTLRNIVSEAERLQKLTNQLLTLSKAEAMDTLPDLMQLPLVSLLLEVVERFPAERLKLNFDEFVQEPFVVANEELLQTAFANIVDNALKYSNKELVSIDFTQDKNHYIVRVADMGIGINEADLKQIYVPLFRARNARKLHGHGVGLPLARRIILLHKGQLLVESQGEDKGTVVTITLPRV